MFYIHPREIDPHQPKLDMGYLRRFKSYVNLDTTEEKVKQIVTEFDFTTFEGLEEYEVTSKALAVEDVPVTAGTAKAAGGSSR